ncbi:MAG: TlpA family protein disulfide reductase [Thermodesulfobacteriota bacterium]
MKTSHWLICLVALALGALLLTAPLAAVSAADAFDKPTILEFARRLCPVCLKNAQVLKEVEARYSDQINLRFIFIDDEEHLFRKYGVTIVPTQVFLDASGKEVYRHTGPLSEAELIGILQGLKFIRD